MPYRCFAALAAVALSINSSASFGRTSAATPSEKDTVWNYDAGIFFATDGSVANGPCFRVTGKVTAPAFFDRPKRVTVFAERGYPIVLARPFFDGLKRIDHAEQDTVFRRGGDTLTQYPNELLMR